MPAARNAARKSALKIAWPSEEQADRRHEVEVAHRQSAPHARAPTLRGRPPRAAAPMTRVERLDRRVERHEQDRQHDERVEDDVRQPPLLEVGGREDEHEREEHQVDGGRPRRQLGAGR